MEIFYFQQLNFFLTALGVVNLTLGVFLGFRQLRKSDDKVTEKKK